MNVLMIEAALTDSYLRTGSHCAQLEQDADWDDMSKEYVSHLLEVVRRQQRFAAAVNREDPLVYRRAWDTLAESDREL